MNYRDAKQTDLQNIMEILQLSNLPSEDCAEHLRNFIIVQDEEKIIGIGGLEVYGTFGLLRSVAVVPVYRGRGIGKIIYKAIEEKAVSIGVNTLFLLTESAETYFSRFGFTVKARNEVPTPIVQTRQFKYLCPSSAKVMYLLL